MILFADLTFWNNGARIYAFVESSMAKVFHIHLIQVKYTYLIPYRFESPKIKQEIV